MVGRVFTLADLVEYKVPFIIDHEFSIEPEVFFVCSPFVTIHEFLYVYFPKKLSAHNDWIKFMEKMIQYFLLKCMVQTILNEMGLDITFINT